MASVAKKKKFCNIDARIFLFLVIFSFLGAPTDGQTINIPNAIQFLEKFRNKLLELAGDAAAGLTSGWAESFLRRDVSPLLFLTL